MDVLGALTENVLLYPRLHITCNIDPFPDFDLRNVVPQPGSNDVTIASGIARSGLLFSMARNPGNSLCLLGRQLILSLSTPSPGTIRTSP